MPADFVLFLIRVLCALGMPLPRAVAVARDARMYDAALRLARVPNTDVVLVAGPYAGRTGVLTHMAPRGCRVCLDVDTDFVESVVLPAGEAGVALLVI